MVLTVLKELQRVKWFCRVRSIRVDELNDTRVWVRNTCTHDSAKLIVDDEKRKRYIYKTYVYTDLSRAASNWQKKALFMKYKTLIGFY